MKKQNPEDQEKQGDESSNKPLHISRRSFFSEWISSLGTATAQGIRGNEATVLIASCHQHSAPVANLSEGEPTSLVSRPKPKAKI